MDDFGPIDAARDLEELAAANPQSRPRELARQLGQRVAALAMPLTVFGNSVTNSIRRGYL